MADRTDRPAPRMADADLIKAAQFLTRKADEADRENRHVQLRPDASRRLADAILECVNRGGHR